jgi:hypothetical protein
MKIFSSLKKLFRSYNDKHLVAELLVRNDYNDTSEIRIKFDSGAYYLMTKKPEEYYIVNRVKFEMLWKFNQLVLPKEVANNQNKQLIEDFKHYIIIPDWALRMND